MVLSYCEIGLTITEHQKFRKPIPVLKKLWVDDLVIMTAVDLKSSAVSDPSLGKEGPVPYHSRTHHSLPEENNVLQQEATKLQKFAEDNFMKINQLKTKVAIFNPLSTVDVMPKISFDGKSNLEVVEEYKLLGQILSTDMKTMKNTKHILKKAYSKMYMLHRLNKLGCPKNEMIEVLKQQILCMAEQAVPFWGPSITKVESRMIEGILKTGLHIILKDEYVSFQKALKKTGLKSMAQRRKNMIFKFAKNAERSPKFSSWFVKSDVQVNKRLKPKHTYKPVTCRTNRYEQSSLPVLTKAVSWHPPKMYIAPQVY